MTEFERQIYHNIINLSELDLVTFDFTQLKYICLTSVTRVKCGIRSTLCRKVGNISGIT